MNKRIETQDALRLAESYGSERPIVNLAVKTAVAQAVLGDDIFTPGTIENQITIDELHPADGLVKPIDLLVAGLNRHALGNLNKKITTILGLINAIRDAEATIPNIFNPNLISRHLSTFRQKVWPEYLYQTESELFTSNGELLRRQSQWEIVVLDVGNTMLRNSAVLERIALPLIEKPPPTMQEYLASDVSSGDVGHIMGKASKLANKARGIKYQRQPGFDLDEPIRRPTPPDISMHRHLAPPSELSTMSFRFKYGTRNLPTDDDEY